MSVATHLGIDLHDYDARIRTFIPDYEEMLDAAASVIPAGARRILDLGTGTGALAARCAARARRAAVVGIDADPQILEMAARRLRSTRAAFVTGSFLHVPLPASDVVVASFALHHVRTRPAKRSLYTRVRAALGSRGILVAVDCHPARERTLATAQFDGWHTHLRRAYSAIEARRLLRAWSKEDVYVPLDAEIEILGDSGFKVEVVWRKGAFAVLAARPLRRRSGSGR